MPSFHHSKRSYNILISLYKTIICLSKYADQNAGNMSQNFLGKLNTLYSKRAGKIISFYIKMTIFFNCFEKHLIKIYTNTHQIAPLFKKISEDLLNLVMNAHLLLFEKK